MRGRRRLAMRPQPSCAPRPFLQPCQSHDSRSAVVDDADAKIQRRGNPEETASYGVGRPAKGARTPPRCVTV
jgi:hypothetical protein